jgi:hypothetical protein
MFTAIQGACLIAVHELGIKFLTTVALRLYNWQGTDRKKVAEFMNSDIVKEAEKAQLNSAEYSALLIAPLLFLALKDNSAEWAATLSVVGQVGYYWARLAHGYPSFQPATFATVRYAGLTLICIELWTQAFGPA